MEPLCPLQRILQIFACHMIVLVCFKWISKLAQEALPSDITWSDDDFPSDMIAIIAFSDGCPDTQQMRANLAFCTQLHLCNSARLRRQPTEKPELSIIWQKGPRLELGKPDSLSAPANANSSPNTYVRWFGWLFKIVPRSQGSYLTAMHQGDLMSAVVCPSKILLTLNDDCK